MRIVFIVVAPLVLTGCIASVAKTVVTAPVKVVSKTVDLATTSQEEADRNRGRKLRKEEKKARKQAEREQD